MLALPSWSQSMTEGQEIFTENCTSSCHLHDTDELFKIKNRNLSSKRDLKAMVSNCISVTKVAIFPDDEAEIVEYLNDKFYHFK